LPANTSIGATTDTGANRSPYFVPGPLFCFTRLSHTCARIQYPIAPVLFSANLYTSESTSVCVLTFNNFISCALRTDNWRIINPAVSTSGTVQCRTVYLSVRSDLRIRIGHCHRQLFSPTSGRQFLENTINTASQNTLDLHLAGKIASENAQAILSSFVF